MMKHIYYFLAFLFITSGAAAQDIDQLITKEHVDYLVKTLSSDEMAGRGINNPGIEKAARFIEDEFKKIGLQPMDGATGYRQHFTSPFLVAESNLITINGQPVPENQFVVIKNTATKLVFDQSGGEWIRFDPSKPFLEQYIAIRNNKKCQLVLLDPKFERDFKMMRDGYTKARVLTEEEVQHPSETVIILVLTPETAVKDFKVAITNSLQQIKLANLIGVIPGKSKEKELVLFSSHYDHMGIVPPDATQDSIANGADDNATGVTAVLALAKYYKSLNNNERTLVFISFTAEEMGLIGSKYYAEQINPDAITAMINFELIGKKNKRFGEQSAYITGYEKSDFGKILQKNAKGKGFTFHPDPYWQQVLFYRSDNAPLAALGVPAHTIVTAEADKDPYYHTVKDDYDSLDIDTLLNTIRGVAKSAFTLVNGTDTPARIGKLVE